MLSGEGKLREIATQFGQQHLLAFWDGLSGDGRAALLEELKNIDFPLIARLAEQTESPASSVNLDRIKPPVSIPYPEFGVAEAEAPRIRRIGEDAIRAGRVAALTVAGGQGTRLGYDGPKGCMRIGPVSGKTLFQLFAEGIRASRERYGSAVPWYIMTGPQNEAATRSYFEVNGYFGLPLSDVVLFSQGVMPAVDRAGKILLSEPGRVALSPDGHGGCLAALWRCGALAAMKQGGVDVISYFQVDNPLVRPVDPYLIGLHLEYGAEATSLTVSKADDLERVGNFAVLDGRTVVVEYTELPEAMARKRGPDGARRFDCANLSIFVLSRSLLERVSNPELVSALPWHLALKKVPFVNPLTGKGVEPHEPNAFKFERFIFDMLPQTEQVLLVRSRREECFSPVKNALGVDSLESARSDMSRRATRWLAACGVATTSSSGLAMRDVAKEREGEDNVQAGSSPPSSLMEISPRVAQDPVELSEYLDSHPTARKDLRTLAW